MKDKEFNLKDYDLYQLSNMLMTATETLATKEHELFTKEMEYKNTRDQIMLSDEIQAYGNQALRDLQTDGLMRNKHNKLFIEYNTLVMEVKEAYRLWQSLKESSANMRAAMYGEARF